MGRLLRSAALGALMLMGVGQAGASPLYGTSVDGGVGVLFTVNPANGAFSNIDAINGGKWPFDTNIAFAPDGTL
jgi:hypothetical protein